MSMSTLISNSWLCPVSSHNTRETAPGALPLSRIWLGLTAKASTMVGSATEMRLMRAGEVITSDRPTNTCRVSASPGDCGACAGGVCGAC